MISKNTVKTVKSLETKKGRNREGLFVAEGPKVVGDLIRHGMKPVRVMAVAEWIEANPLIPTEEATQDELRKLSFLQHPQQVVALFRLPESHGHADAKCPEKELCLALDGVQDPGNVGTILRIADWFGIRTVYCSEDTADIYNPKVVQATMGSIARVNVVYTDLAELFSRLSPDVPVYGTLLDGQDIYAQELSSTGIIVMGNEGKGISDVVRPLVNKRLLIPPFSIGDGAESLNVAIATAVVCSEFRRRSR